MFENLLKNEYRTNLDVIYTTNKILLDGVPINDAFNFFLLNKENKQLVIEVLTTIQNKEKHSPLELSLKKKRSYIIDLNKIVQNQSISI